MRPFIARWRDNALSMYGMVRGLTEGQRKKVTKSTKGHALESKPKKVETKEKKKTKKVRKLAPKSKKGAGKGRYQRVLGNLGWKGLLVGSLALMGAKYVTKRFVPVGAEYVNGVSMMAAGYVGSAAKIGGTAGLKSAGAMDLISEFGSNLMLGAPTGLGQGGYDA